MAARQAVGERASLQGNFNPRLLVAKPKGSGTPEAVRDATRLMLKKLGPQRLIANLAEGLGGQESPELVEAFVEAVRTESAALIHNVTDEAKSTGTGLAKSGVAPQEKSDLDA